MPHIKEEKRVLLEMDSRVLLELDSRVYAIQGFAGIRFQGFGVWHIARQILCPLHIHS
jgi:hypothetical protein